MRQFYLKKRISFLLIFFIFYIGRSYAQPGIDQAGTISSPGTIVNEYTFLTADAATGATSITVNNSNLNTNSRFSSGALNIGDLIMIIQMQGAIINGTPNDSTWGAITNYNNCGNYEFFQVGGVPNSTTIELSCELKNSYTAAGKVQIVRVPRYSSLTINSGATLMADAWNGAQGGIVAVEVDGNTVINPGGTIDVSGLGFRGGAVQSASDFPDITRFALSSADSAGSKGESIAGYQSDYNQYGGMYGRGAPGNGGGGGNSVNAAGGGGANAGNIKTYTGNGNPDASVSQWKTAWNLEYNGFANSTSSGGGRGGYSWGANNANPLTDGPGNSAWGGDDRRNHGGKGGRPLDYSTGKIFMGGGGGAGQANNASGGGGGNGGGIVYIISYGNVSGGGTVNSNGQNGQDNNATASNKGAGAGGGGGAGTVLIAARYSATGISVNANGGNGGNQIISTTETEGPGGGGGGGYIANYRGSLTASASAGLNGTSNASPLVNFPPNGATKGGAGIANAYATPFYAAIAPVGGVNPASICFGQSEELIYYFNKQTTSPADTIYADSTYTFAWETDPTIDKITSKGDSTEAIVTPVKFTNYVITGSNGICARKDTFALTVISLPVLKPRTIDTICPGKSVTLNPSDSTDYSFSWSPATGLSCTDCENPVASPSSNINYTVTASNQNCTSTAIHIVRLAPLPTISFPDSIFCYNQSSQINVKTNGTLTWSPSTYLSCTSCNNPQITLSNNTTYSVTVTSAKGCTATTTSFNAIVDQPSISAGTDTTIVQTTSAILHGSGTQKFVWSPSATLSSPDSANPVASPSITTTYTLMGTDSLGCSAQASVVVFVKSPCSLPVLPNAFSPNGNGKNDVYRILNHFVDKLLVFSIYDRWGQLVFQTDDVGTGWDGTYKGKPAQVGVYEYYLKVICNGVTQSYQGNVTLLR